MTRLLPFLLILIFQNIFAQNKIFYNKNGEITIRELASHFRIANVDVEKRKFIATAREYSLDSLLFMEINYDSAGNKNGDFAYKRERLNIIGKFEVNNPKGKFKIVTNNKTDTIQIPSIPDSLKEILIKKEKFIQATYIRKKDYPGLRLLLSSYKFNADSIAMHGDIFTVVEQSPAFPGGMPALAEFIGYFLVYPPAAKAKKITGNVFVELIIMPDGTLEQIKTVKGLGYGCNEAAEYAISKLPDWTPGYQRGKAVPVKLVIPIAIRYQ